MGVYAPISEAPEAAGDRTARLHCRRAGAAVLAATFSVGAAAFWLHGRLKRLGSEPQQATFLEKFVSGTGECGKIEQNIDFVSDSPWFTNLDHIPTVEMCCALCQGNSKCKSFTWVKNAGLDGCPSQCWLKGGEPTQRRPKAGVVSGLPPPRKVFTGLPASPASPTLSCFSLTVPNSTEPALLNWQSQHSAGIFACDKTTVYSNRIMPVGNTMTHMVDSDLKCKYGGDSQSALNSWIFIAVWKAVVKDGYFRTYDWTVKADPDAVFLPHRLKTVLASHTGAPYVNNCQYGMHGPIEVLGRIAMEKLEESYQESADGRAPKRCVEGLHFGQWGEDMFLDQCLSKIYGLKAPIENRLMCEDHCDCSDFYWCSASKYPDRVSFHPFKTVDAYSNCIANALAGSTQGAGSSSSNGVAANAPAPQPVAPALAAPAPAPQPYYGSAAASAMAPAGYPTPPAVPAQATAASAVQYTPVPVPVPVPSPAAYSTVH